MLKFGKKSYAKTILTANCGIYKNVNKVQVKWHFKILDFISNDICKYINYRDKNK